MSQTRPPYNLRPEELLQQQTDVQEEKSRQFLIDLRNGHLQIVDALERYLGMERTADLRAQWKRGKERMG